MTVALVPGPVQASLAQLAGAQLGSRVTLPRRRDGYFYDNDDDCYYDYNVYMDIWIYIHIHIHIYICMYVCIQYFPQFLSVEFFLREAQGRPIDWDGCNWNERAQDLKVMGRIGNSFSGLGKCQIFVGDDILNSWVMFS
jgi:hypothetical protein